MVHTPKGISTSLGKSTLETYLVNYLFKNGIETQEMLLAEFLKSRSAIISRLLPYEKAQLATAFFSNN